MYEPPFSAIRRPMPRSTVERGRLQQFAERLLADLLLLLELDEGGTFLEPQPDQDGDGDQEDRREERDAPDPAQQRVLGHLTEADEHHGRQQRAEHDADEGQRRVEAAAPHR